MNARPTIQIVINTWPFRAANEAAWQTLLASGDEPRFGMPTYQALEAAVDGCTACETLQCDGTVGFGGSPDESGETTLDAMVIDAVRMDIGSVAALRRVKNAVGVARAVLFHTTHTMLAGELATEFAADMGFAVESLSTNTSEQIWRAWQAAQCQPNYRQRVLPDAAHSCGPYKPNGVPPTASAHSLTAIAEQRAQRRPVLHASLASSPSSSSPDARASHDTISMVTIDKAGRIAAATSTNGAAHKVPGRVGDGPIPGAGAYAEQGIGGCGGTGDGDIHMRFLPCYQAVQSLKLGMSPQAAAEDAMRRMLKYYPVFQGALFVIDMQGNHGGACTGWTFTYTVQSANTQGPQVVTVPPLTL